jgi:TFIIH basal transcription factor complex TTD-A subunit
MSVHPDTSLDIGIGDPFGVLGKAREGAPHTITKWMLDQPSTSASTPTRQPKLPPTQHSQDSYQPNLRTCLAQSEVCRLRPSPVTSTNHCHPGVLIECDPSIKSIIVNIDSANHDYIIEDLDEERVVVKETMVAALKLKLEEVRPPVAYSSLAMELAELTVLPHSASRRTYPLSTSPAPSKRTTITCPSHDPLGITRKQRNIHTKKTKPNSFSSLA